MPLVKTIYYEGVFTPKCTISTLSNSFSNQMQFFKTDVIESDNQIKTEGEGAEFFHQIMENIDYGRIVHEEKNEKVTLGAIKNGIKKKL